MDDDAYISYREDTKFHAAIIETHLPEMEKNLLFKFAEDNALTSCKSEIDDFNEWVKQNKKK